MVRVWGVAALALLALAGCGGGSGGTTATTGSTMSGTAGTSGGGSGSSSSGTTPTPQTDPAAYFSQIISPGYDSYQAALVGNSHTGATGLPNTAYASMPSSGTANFNGYAFLIANSGSQVVGQPSIGIEGTATLSVDFSNNSASGSATNFVGGPIGALDTTTGKYPLTQAAIAYPGSIAISNGCVGANHGCSSVTRPNQMQADFSGTLAGGGNTITANGQVLADFKGTPIQGVAVSGGTITTKINGNNVPGAFYFYVKP